MTDWNHIRSVRFSDGPTPPDWPKDVRPISMPGVSLLGVNESDGRLYWDGREVVLRSRVRLGGIELFWLALASVSTFVGAVAAVATLFVS